MAVEVSWHCLKLVSPVVQADHKLKEFTGGEVVAYKTTR